MKIQEEKKGKLVEDQGKSIQLYYSDIDTELSPSEYEQCTMLITPEKARRLERFHFEEDRKRTLYGEVMARCLFMKQLGVKNQELVIEKNQYGKPYFSGITTLHFNISHSGRYVLCGISDQEIGVDIEEIKGLHEEIAKRYFTKQEYESLKKLDENEAKKLFYTYWTLKESYIKYQGKGLSIPLDSFSIGNRAEGFVLETISSTENIQLFSQSLDTNYMIAAAYGGKKRKVELIYRNIKEFCRW